MITRILAWLIDAGLVLGRAVGRLRQGLSGVSSGDLWRIAPGDLLGRIVVAGCRTSDRARRVPVLRPDGSTLCEAILVEDPRNARYLDAVPIRPTAQTLGRYVVGRRPLPEATVRHELEHVRQWSRLGPLFLPSYGLASLAAVLAGEHSYWGNAFERAARASEAPAGPPAVGDPATAGAAAAPKQPAPR